MSTAPKVDIERILRDEQARSQPPKRLPPIAATKREFQALGEARYRLVVPDLGVAFDLDRARRERGELVGELCVTCDLPGAKTVDGILSAADFNLSSARARAERAKLLDAKCCTKGNLDWGVLLEEFCVRVIRADRDGAPLEILGDPKPDYRANLTYTIDGLVLMRHHPSILFGGPGTNKSYIALRALGELAAQGKNCLYVDWELEKEDHEARKKEMFPGGTRPIGYMRCYRPLVEEVDRICRDVKAIGIDYIVYDSAAYAVAGAPESAEVTLAYWRAVRQIGVGSLTLAHNPKPDANGKVNDQEPFGSRFWKANARQMWYAQADESTTNPRLVALYCRKASMDKLSAPVTYRIEWADGECEFSRANIMESRELSAKLPVREQIYQLLRSGPKTADEISDELDLKLDTVQKTVNRCLKKGTAFIVLEGKKIGLRR